MNKDLRKEREFRKNSNIVKCWGEYKNNFINNVLLDNEEEICDKMCENMDVVETTVDTLIGWLNTPVGREYLKKALGDNILFTADGLWENFYNENLHTDKLLMDYGFEEEEIIKLKNGENLK